MKYTVAKYNRAKSDMLGEFNKAIADAEDLRNAETAVSDDGSAAAQENAAEMPESAGADPTDAPKTVVETQGKTADAAGEDVRYVPWRGRPANWRSRR